MDNFLSKIISDRWFSLRNDKGKVRVLLIDPVSIKGYSYEGSDAKSPSPHMGLICLATFISSKHGAEAHIVEMGISGEGHSDIRRTVKKIRPHIVGLTSRTFNILGAYKTAAVVKSVSKDILVLAGGSHPTALPEGTLNECMDIDGIVRGEGELTLGEIVERFVRGVRDFKDLLGGVKGVTHRNMNGKIISEPDRELISDLDSLPLPDFSYVDYRVYRKVLNPEKKEDQYRYPVFYSRGCPFNCTFCMSPKSQRLKSPERVVSEIEDLHKRHGAEFVFFEDSTFNPNGKWLEEFCNLYIEKGLHRLVNWSFGTRIDTGNSFLFEWARKAGCVYIFFGIESGSELVLTKARKRFTKEQIMETLAAARKADIPSLRASFILGLPYETRETIQETLDLIKVLPLDSIGVGILDVYPATDIFDMAERGEGGLKWIPGKRLNWDSYSRSDAQVTVNDLSGKDLLDYRDKARKIMIEKRKKTRR